MRLLFTTAPLGGQFFPMVPLAWAARVAGHDVLVATTERFAPVVLRSGLPVVSWGDPPGFVDLVADQPAASQDTVLARRRAHGRAFGRIAADCLPGARSVVAAWKPDVVISERAEFAGPLAAAALDVPRVSFHWGVAPLAEYAPEVAAQLGGDDVLAGLPEPMETLNPWPRRMRLPYAAGHRGIRAVAYNGDARVPDWLLGEPPRRRICVTFGTLLPRMAALGLRDVVAPLLARLALLDAELCVAADDDVLAQWPELAEHAVHIGRLPMAQLLRTCDLVVNHGGQGTVLTALEAGCPQLVLPHIDDQFDNADAVVRAGAGLSLALDEITPERVTSRCRTLLEDDPGGGRSASSAGRTFTAAAGRVSDEIAGQLSPVEIVDLLGKLVG
ncbi:nucleotide disphospho-sugar-binding domain-containing protein [Amycolatopsis suaedae]|uniref:Glycosyltransferase n=1 Tax=Amycolatopsis suaedae TaxID=2510978 RepID=A0A4Q7J2L2_9PSEU|nr:nucleotide disphospho-sugar-binding domain-containing protein [Amycolatopsis suaedae]RZQ61149.1 glycosyltransferase [Amycolatopsis suaedae]